MALDELGADPYQRAAISCARKGAVVSALSVCGALAAVFKGGEQTLYMVAGALVLCALSLGVAQRQLSKESLGWSDMC